MKLTLWRQFSSNHSAFYTVVGRFSTEAEAQRAGAEVGAFLNAVGAWYDHVRRTTPPPLHVGFHLTPPEEAIKERYGLAQYETALDWCYSRELAIRAVTVLKEVVIVRNPVESWDPLVPFWELFEKMGSTPEGFVDYDDDPLHFYLTCEFEDEGMAQRAFSAITRTDVDPTPHFELPDGTAFHGDVALHSSTLHFRKVEFRDVVPLDAIFAFINNFPATSVSYEVKSPYEA